MLRGSRSRNRAGHSGRYHGPRPASSNARGLLADGIWHCDCQPRLPAEHFKVKKEGKNQGRWFYTCQQNENKRCGFFLWDEDAKPREEAAVLSNSRTEPGGKHVSGDAQEGWNAGRGLAQPTMDERGLFARNEQRGREEDEETASPSPPLPSGSPEKQANGVKRTAQVAGMDDDEDLFPWPLTGQEEAELAKTAESAHPETPYKVQKTGVYATPVTTTRRKLPWQQQPTTPPTGFNPASEYFDTPSKPPQITAPPAEVTTPHAPPTLATATSPSPPIRFRDALINPADSASSLTTEALASLASAKVPPDILLNLRAILSKHDLKTQGVMKGRDISRLAIKAKDAKIVELQAKIVSLEAEREVDRGVIGKLKWDIENGRGAKK